jgi:hypothetical protein
LRLFEVMQVLAWVCWHGHRDKSEVYLHGVLWQITPQLMGD